MPNYTEYHKSLTDELHALKNRIRNLSEHWATDGEYKEAALRTVLRRHLPESLIVGRGFIVTEHSSSTQIDLLIVDSSKPTLFRDGDLMFVTPDCVRAVIEVKTSLPSSSDVEECAIKLAKVGQLCRDNGDSRPWLGIFSYEGTLRQNDLILDALIEAHRQTGALINCMAYGKDRFVRFWEKDEIERGDAPEGMNVGRWRIYRLEHLASAYFVGNIVDSLSSLSRSKNAFAWYPLTDGKRVRMEAERTLAGEQ
jgi:uncharacterized protein DUF6602